MTLAKLKAAALAASPGPWVVPEYDKADPAYRLVCTVEKLLKLELPFIQVVPVTNGDLRDAHYIAAASPDVVLNLLASIEEMRQTLEGALTYDPLIDCYKLKDYFARNVKPALANHAKRFPSI